MIAAPRQNVGIGRGDDAPAIIWAMPYAVYGSDFALAITVAGSPATLYAAAGAPTVTIYTVLGGGLALDPVANTVTWTPTTAESAALPPVCAYTLQRIVPEVRYYACGDLYGIDGPVWPSSVDVEVPGPQGPLPSNAQIVAAVESVIGQPGGIAGEDALAAEIVRAKGAETALTAGQAAAAPKSYPIAIVSRGQTAVPMPTPPSVLSSVRLIVNFCEYAAPIIGATATTLTWLNADFPLEPSDNVILTYV